MQKTENFFTKIWNKMTIGIKWRRGRLVWIMAGFIVGDDESSSAAQTRTSFVVEIGKRQKQEKRRRRASSLERQEFLTSSRQRLVVTHIRRTNERTNGRTRYRVHIFVCTLRVEENLRSRKTRFGDQIEVLPHSPPPTRSPGSVGLSWARARNPSRSSSAQL